MKKIDCRAKSIVEIISRFNNRSEIAAIISGNLSPFGCARSLLAF
jgi:hypothetical protein